MRKPLPVSHAHIARLQTSTSGGYNVVVWCLGVIPDGCSRDGVAGGPIDVDGGMAFLFTPPDDTSAIVVQTLGDIQRNPFPATHGRPVKDVGALPRLQTVHLPGPTASCGSIGLVDGASWTSVNPINAPQVELGVRLGGDCASALTAHLWLFDAKGEEAPEPLGSVDLCSRSHGGTASPCWRTGRATWAMGLATRRAWCSPVWSTRWGGHDRSPTRSPCD